ncbi:MAG TPA: S-methyl-5'-thioinosine phosphorylase [Gammaproteobacteria bacterium]|nr:S-methyl-5'-thioinosine phosphorylase [Gammaproteobacteria bacterium]
MTELAIIGGTGLRSLKSLHITERVVVHTPYGEPSGPLTIGMLAGKKVIFIARHGYRHTIPPHEINYRANLWALKYSGARKVIAVAAVGGIRADLKPADIVIPDQIIDYTAARAQTFFESGQSPVTHIDFTHPYSQWLRELLICSCQLVGLQVHVGATYGATQGPRLETTAEINRMERDGCDIVGMTGMPEAALAREMEMDYATCAVIANAAAGRGAGDITMQEIEQNLKVGMEKVRQLLEHVIPLI